MAVETPRLGPAVAGGPLSAIELAGEKAEMNLLSGSWTR